MMNEQLAGRLGDPGRTLLTDPRLDPRIKAAMEMAGALGDGVEEIDPTASYEDCLAYCQAFEAAGEAAHPIAEAMMPEYPGVESWSEVITGVDGNEITLFVHRPKNTTGKIPAVVHTHGGGMVLMAAADPGFVRWRNELANAGLVVVGVEFRNGGGKLGNHPYPAGLNDCAAGARWTYANREKLGISGMIISGESGGGNLSIATTLMAKREGWLDEIKGVFACCPYISGTYVDPPQELVSQQGNADYMLGGATMGVMVKVYDPAGTAANDPLAWPLQATTEELQGLPAHIVSVNELDPLRDEGLAFFRNLQAAGVSAVARTVHGTPHAGDLMLPDVNPETYADTLRSVVAFAHACVGAD